ncbi:MAG: pyruvate kinase [bacterium]|nr:pyruvate kinase [bacterium]
MKTEIVCTIGPVSDSVKILKELVDAGMSMARVNFSHGDRKEIIRKVRNIMQVRSIKGKKLPILADLQGPKIRIGHFKKTKIYLKTGQRFIITTRKITGTIKSVSVDYENLHKYVMKDDSIFLDDGKIELKIDRVKNTDIVCEVIVGGELSSRKGISVVGKTLPLPGITEQDYRDAEFAVSLGITYFAQSFVRKADDVVKLKEFLIRCNPANRYFVIAKIEDYNGYKNIDSIIEVSDGIMVARGDLGVSVQRALVPLIQKEIIEKCNKANKLDIVATQMLDSMTENPYPTRAEVNDVAVAVMQGADYLLLSSETAAGKYPVLATREMKKIINTIERYINKNPLPI